MRAKINRRSFIKFVGGVGILSIVSFRIFKEYFEKKKIKGIIQGADFSRGHLIRDPIFPRSVVDVEIDTLIIGAGISGLSAGRYLQARHEDFLILDLERSAGGNARSAENQNGHYPLGAHYIPLLSRDDKDIKNFFKEVDIIQGEDNEGEPIYNPYYLCSTPSERLYLNGRWQEGLIPNQGISKVDQKEIKTFLTLMSKFKHQRDTKGFKAFSLPISFSSKEAEFTKFDKMTMKQYLSSQSLSSKYLHWYVNYCCLDDFGAEYSKVSAWAGIHYFAARDATFSKTSSTHVLTWPEGNDFLVNKLKESFVSKIKLNSLAYEITKNNNLFTVSVFNFYTNKTTKYNCHNIIYAAPLFTAMKTIKIEAIHKQILPLQVSSAPWMTATIQLNAPLDESDSRLAWDNVNYHGKGLGYVVANHQELTIVKKKLNLTLYWPQSDLSPTLARVRALAKTHQQWCQEVLSEFEIIHPDLKNKVGKIDISLFGHAMAIPKVGFLKNSSKNLSIDGIHFAHTDLSGMSLFEEAFYQGLNAAKRISQ